MIGRCEVPDRWRVEVENRWKSQVLVCVCVFKLACKSWRSRLRAEKRIWICWASFLRQALFLHLTARLFSVPAVYLRKVLLLHILHIVQQASYQQQLLLLLFVYVQGEFRLRRQSRLLKQLFNLVLSEIPWDPNLLQGFALYICPGSLIHFSMSQDVLDRQN